MPVARLQQLLEADSTLSSFLSRLIPIYSVQRSIAEQNSRFVFETLCSHNKLGPAAFRQFVELLGLPLPYDSVSEYFYAFQNNGEIQWPAIQHFLNHTQAARFIQIKKEVLQGVVSTQIKNSLGVASHVFEKFLEFWAALTNRGLIALEKQPKAIESEREPGYEAQKIARFQNISVLIDVIRADLDVFDVKNAVLNMQKAVHETIRLMNAGNGGVLLVALDQTISLLSELVGAE